MRTTNATTRLDEKILMLEGRKAYELQELKEQWHVTYESMKPMNLIKSTFKEVTSSPEIKNNLVGNLVGLASGYLSKKLIIGTAHNPITKIAGAVLQFAVTNIVGKKIAAKQEEKELKEQENSTVTLSNQ